MNLMLLLKIFLDNEQAGGGGGWRETACFLTTSGDIIHSRHIFDVSVFEKYSARFIHR